jgi:hypothetical protein
MRPAHVLALLVTAAGACGPGAAAPKPIAKPVVQAPPPGPKRYLITLLSGSVDGQKADGTAWDEKKSSAGAWMPQAGGPLSLYVHAHPELEGAELTIGEPVETPGQADAANGSGAADPMVIVEVNGNVFRSPMRASQFQPTWQYPFVVDLAPADLVKITVVDWDGPAAFDVMGEKIMAAADVTAARVLELPRFGNVTKLTLTVEAAPVLAATQRVAVPGRPTWTETGINVIAGSEITIFATGETCQKGNEKCCGPEGLSKPSEDSQVRGFEKKGHGMLIGAVGDTRFTVGRERRFIAPSSGPLLLGVNDSDASNNKGEYEVAVTIK